LDFEAIDIQDFLPHRPTFLMVEKFHALDETSVESSFTIPQDNVFSEEGAFNEFGLLENAAQTCSSIVGQSFFEKDDLTGSGTKLIGFISAVKKVDVFKLPKIGQTIFTRASLKSRFDSDGYSICTLNCDIFESEQKLLACELNLFIQELK